MMYFNPIIINKNNLLKMIAKKRTSPDYENYSDMHEATNQSEGGNNAERHFPRSRNAQDDYVLWEYDGEEETGVYVLERAARLCGSDATVSPASESRRPGHISADPGVYDSLDYEQSPRIKGSSNHPATEENRRKSYKQKKVLILSILITLLIGAVCAAVVLSVQSNYFSIFGQKIY